MSVKRLAILFSGEGSNLEALINQLHQKNLKDINIEVVIALTNNPDANGIKRAQKYGIKPIVLNHKEYDSREDFDTKLVEVLKNYKVDLTILAGFMRILTPIFTENISAINIHPSLLPLFKGANAIEQSFTSNMKVAGVSTHMVTTELDSGEIIDQACFHKETMDFDTFKAKISEIEHELFAKSVRKVLLRDTLL